MRIQPEAREGELGHVCSAHHHEPCIPQPRHGRRIDRSGLGVSQRNRPCRGGLPGNIEQVLDRHRDACESADSFTRRAPLVERVAFVSRPVGRDRQKRSAALAIGIGDPVECILDQLTSGDRAFRKTCGEIGNRLNRGVHRPHVTQALSQHPIPRCTVGVS